MGGTSDQKSSSSTRESRLSKQQSEILATREQQYLQVFFPALTKGLEEAMSEPNQTALMQGQARAINQETAGARQQFAQAMAQRNLTGTGVEAQGLAGIGNTRSSLLADAYYNTHQANQDRQMQYLQFGLGMSPQPTTAAPLHQSSNSSGSSWKFF